MPVGDVPKAMAACGCCEVDRPSDACCSSALVRACTLEVARQEPWSSRVFDHLDRVPFAPPLPHEERTLNRVAFAMRGYAGPFDKWDRHRGTEWWKSVPQYEEPAPISGEFIERKARAKAALERLLAEDPAAVADAFDSIAEQRRRRLKGRLSR